MKRLIASVLLTLLFSASFSQAPQKFNYQAVARSAAGTVLANQNINIRLSILEGSASGTASYVETQQANTNQFGLFSLQVGTGTVTSGTFSNINWGNGSKFLKTEFDPTGGTNFSISGTTEMVSVPYALYAKEVSNPLWNKTGNNINNTNTGRVGIGTSVPKAKLHVADSSVLFSGPDTLPSNPADPPSSGGGARTMWYADKGAFRIGSFGNGASTGWDKANIGNYSFASGYANRAQGSNAVAFGSFSNAQNNNSIAIGTRCGAYSTNSIAIGTGAYTDRPNQIALGNYNSGGVFPIPDDNPPIFYLGNGNETTSGGLTITTYSNALTVCQNGNMSLGNNLFPKDKLLINHNSTLTSAHLNLFESENNDFSRLRMSSYNQTNYWDMAGITRSLVASSELNFFFSGSSNVLSLKGNGNATLMGTLTQNSDERLKKNIVPMATNMLDKIALLGAYTYQWKDDNRDQSKQIGFLAQEIEKVFPELVKTEENDTKSVAYTGMVPVLLEATKELKVKYETTIEDLKQQISELKSMIQAIKP